MGIGDAGGSGEDIYNRRAVKIVDDGLDFHFSLFILLFHFVFLLFFYF